MLLEISTTSPYANDISFLLHKHPDKLHTIDLSLGQAYVLYSEATNERCTACLLVDINPLDLVRGRRNAFLQEHYVNDRPYTSNSFLCTAITKAYGSALNGNCQHKPELVDQPMPVKATVHALKVGCDKSYLQRLFEPLGYRVSYETAALDPQFPDWGESDAVNLTVEATLPLKDLLAHLYVLIMVLDCDRHYWISKSDIEVLIKRGEGWLEKHPEKEWITKRYLKEIRSLTTQALIRLSSEEGFRAADESEKVVGLHTQRLNTARDLLVRSRASSVLDIGCGDGKLLKLLLKEQQFKRIHGMDVSFGELQKAKENLHLNEASPLMKERLHLFQSSVTYKDDRFKGFDAIAMVEVIEHLDEERLPAMEKVIFSFAHPETVVISTPNAEYNIKYENLHAFRHEDHRFEWSREVFATWCNKVGHEYKYDVAIYSIGQEDKLVGAPSQIAVFKKQ